MCGIAGIYNFDGEPVDRAILAEMTSRLARRGPDGSGVWSEGPAGLGHRRLAIRDLSPAGAQPFHSACNNVVVSYNGEIYNDRELASELSRTAGFSRRTTCDTEVIPAAYLAWGERFVERLEGIFAIALYDRRDGRLLLARDANGTKPLYVRRLSNSLQFASDTTAFRGDPQYRTRLDPVSLHEMLALGYVAPGRSLFEDIYQIPPGTLACFRGGHVSSRRFWEPSREPVDAMTLDEDAGQVIGMLHRVVEDQVVSDVPLAVLQSGGIDSTLISASLPAKCDAHLYTVRFAERSHDESEAARLVAEKLGRPINFIDLGKSEVAADFRAMVASVDGALADSSALATFQLSRAVRQHAVVALSGDGADEYFGGYPTYRATAIANRLKSLFPAAPFRLLAEGVRLLSRPSSERIGTVEIITRMLDGLGSKYPHENWRRYLRSSDRNGLYDREMADQLHKDPLDSYAAAGHGAEDIWDRAMLADQRFYLPGDMLIKTDRTSMYHGLEVRVPFLDRRMCELAGRIRRPHLADLRGRKKRVLRRALELLGMPTSISAGSKKGFNIPMNALLMHELRPLADHFLNANADILQPYLKADGVRALWRQHREGSRDHRFVIWTLLVLSTWTEDHSRP